MKLIITAVSIAVSVGLTSVSLGQTDEAARLLDEGNRLFREGDFEGARVSYEGALGLGLESGIAYYNLGNAYFRLDRLGKAMLSYRRAARFLRDDPELRHNIDLVRSRARDQLSILPKPVWVKWWDGLVNLIGLRTMFWIGAAAWLFGLGIVGRRILTGSSGNASRRSALVLVLVGLAAGCGAFATSVARSDDVTAVVVSDRAHVLEQPSNSSRTVIVVHEALVVDVVEQRGEWLHIRLPNGVTGYIEQESAEIV